MKLSFFSLIMFYSFSAFTHIQTFDTFSFVVFPQGKLSPTEFLQKCEGAKVFYQTKLNRLEAAMSEVTGNFIVHDTTVDSVCQISATSSNATTKLVWKLTDEVSSPDMLNICMGQMNELRQEYNSVFARVAYYISDAGTSCQVKQVQMILL